MFENNFRFIDSMRKRLTKSKSKFSMIAPEKQIFLKIFKFVYLIFEAIVVAM